MRRTVAEELVKAWHANASVYHAVQRGLLCDGEIPTPELVQAEIGWSKAYTIARPWFGVRMSVASSMLWDGVTDDKVVQSLMRTLPDKHAKPVWGERGARLEIRESKQVGFVRARSLSKKHDWSTVK